MDNNCGFNMNHTPPGHFMASVLFPAGAASMSALSSTCHPPSCSGFLLRQMMHDSSTASETMQSWHHPRYENAEDVTPCDPQEVHIGDCSGRLLTKRLGWITLSGPGFVCRRRSLSSDTFNSQSFRLKCRSRSLREKGALT